MIEKEATVTTAEGEMPTWIYHPSHDGPSPVVLYLMDAPSIRPALHEMAERLASAGYYVMLPYLYYRNGPFRTFGMSDEDMHARREFMDTLNCTNILGDVQGLLDHAAGDEAAGDGPVGAVGFCMSGPFVISAARAMPERVAAVASIHGAWMVRETDDSPHLGLDTVAAEVYLGWADNDATAPPEEVPIVEQALQDAGGDLHARLLHRCGARLRPALLRSLRQARVGDALGAGCTRCSAATSGSEGAVDGHAVSVSIRELGLADEAMVVELLDRLRPAWRDRLAPGASGPRAFIADPKTFLLGGYVDNEPAGWLWGVHVRRPDGGLMTYVHDVEVAEAHRRRGIATSLVEAALGAARRSGSDRLWLLTEAGNEPANALYRALGGRAIDGGVRYEWTW